MSALEITLLIVALWFAGSLVIVLAEERYPVREVVALLLWPVTVPFFAGTRWAKHRRQTCRHCGRRYHLDHIEQHRVNCTTEGRG